MDTGPSPVNGRVTASGRSREIPVGLQVGVGGAQAGADGRSPGRMALWAADCSSAEGRREAGDGEQPHQRYWETDPTEGHPT